MVAKGNALVDPVVARYWELERQSIERFASSSFSPRRYEEDLEQCIRNRRGLLGGAQQAIHYAIKFIAAGLVAPGLEHARWAVRLSDLALEVGDLGIYQDKANPPSRELGLSWLHEYLYYGKWFLGHREADGELQLWLQNRKANWERIWPNAAPLESAGDKDTGIWTLVVPLLVGGDVREAGQWFIEILGPSDIDPKQVARNAADVRSYLAVLIAHLQGDVREEDARRTMEAFHYNISGWGHEGKDRRAKMWDELLGKEHVMLAQLRARYFTQQTDPIAIVQSIRGVPL